MTALILRSSPLAEFIAPMLKATCASVLHAIDAFAENRMRNAVPESQFRKAERETRRYQRMIHAGHKSAARKRAGR